jgi:outer membrane protein
MKRYGLLILILPALIVLAAACKGNEAIEQKIVFMDSFKVFEGFEMKKDYDAMIEKQLGAEQAQLDSMARKLDAVKDPVQADLQKKQLVEAQQAFEQRFQALSDQYTKDVYERLNKYIQEYGKQKGYSMILGSDGQGGVMYVDTTVNVTTDLIRYVNTQYAK